MYLAKDVEEMPRASEGNGLSSKFRYLQRYGPSSFSLVNGLSNLSRNEPKLPSQLKIVDKVLGGRGDVTCISSSSKLGFSPYQESTLIFQRDWGIHSLSRTEWED
ncbi:hypothetical protein HanRHA438_Chr11g0500661 [Helianthus annuus]|nr:hypothetical protein HanRHA438_Chr11g0500661 [Helianthus annuus]